MTLRDKIEKLVDRVYLGSLEIDDGVDQIMKLISQDRKRRRKEEERKKAREVAMLVKNWLKKAEKYDAKE